MNEINFIAINQERKKTWRKFLFKENWFLNVLFYIFMTVAVFNSFRMIFPEWFVNPNVVDPYSEISQEQFYQNQLAKLSESGLIFMLMMFCSIFFVTFFKYMAYRGRFLDAPFYLEYYKNYHANIIAPSLTGFQITGEGFSFDEIVTSEIVTSKKDLLMETYNGDEMFLRSSCFSGNVGITHAKFGSVLCKVSQLFTTQEGAVKLKNAIIFNQTVFSVKNINCAPLEGKLIIMNSKTEGFAGQKFQMAHSNSQPLDKMDKKDLGSNFKIYASDKDFADIILTKTFRDTLKLWKTKWNEDVKLTLLDDTFTITFSKLYKSLYPRVYRKVNARIVEKAIKKIESIMADMNNVFPETHLKNH